LPALFDQAQPGYATYGAEFAGTSRSAIALQTCAFDCVFGESATKDFRRLSRYFITMTKAIVLVKTVVGAHSDVAASVAKVKGVQTAFPTFGRYDVVAAADVPSLKALSALAREVGGKEGVVATETLVGMEE